MSAEGSSQTYDPNIVIKAADDKLGADDLEGGKLLFQSALLNWVDDAQFAASNPSVDGDSLREAIATLWIAYAHYLQKAKQFKSATEAYEQAVSCPVGSTMGRVWLDYARFLEERGKLRSAQQIYLRALVDDNGGKVQDEQDQNLLWGEFLEMMKTNKPDLTMEDLKKAIAEEHGHPPEQIGSSNSADNDYDDDVAPAAKRARIDNVPIKQEADTQQEVSRTHVVTASDVKTEETALQDIIDNVKTDPQFMASWMVRDGDSDPQAPDISLFEAAPPKLSDPTGKDLLGEELALQLVQRLLEPTGSTILHVSRGLWMMTALKEHQAQKTLKELDESIKEEVEVLRARLDERLSVAGAAADAVRSINQTERQGFENSCNEQRKKVLNDIAWEFRQLLWVQQQFLTKLKIPGFNGCTIDPSELEFQARVCSCLHSAFFLRKRIGEDAHLKMLKSQETRLIQLTQDQPMVVDGSTSPAPTGGRRKKPSRFSPKQPNMGRLSPPPAGGLSPTRNSPVPQYASQPVHLQTPAPVYPPTQVYNPQMQVPQMMSHNMQQYGGGIPQGVVYPPQHPLAQQQYQQLMQQHQQQNMQQMMMQPGGQQMQMMPPGYPQQQQQQYPPQYNPQQQQQQPPQNPPYY